MDQRACVLGLFFGLLALPGLAAPIGKQPLVETSADSTTWPAADEFGHATAGIPIDAIDYGSGDSRSSVRLMDVPSNGMDASAGAHVPIGTTSTRPQQTVPEPGTLLLLLGGLLGLMYQRRRQSQS